MTMKQDLPLHSGRKRFTVHKLTALILAAVLLFSCAGAESAGNGMVSREKLCALYRWMNQTDQSGWNEMTYDRISSMAGKRGAVIGANREDFRSAYWTDGSAFVTVTFRNADGIWVMSGLAVTGMSREEYENADLSLLTGEGNTAVPTAEPTAEPTPEPTPEPTAEPTAEPTPEPTAAPTPEPTPEPAEPFDLSYILDHPRTADGTIRIVENPDQTGNAYIYNSFTAEELSFSHPYESNRFYSYADFDIVLTGAGTEAERPILRLWITLYSDEFSPDISSVSFAINGNEYLFSGLMTDNSVTEIEGTYKQTILIRFDGNGLQFMKNLAFGYLTGASTIRTVFHGRKEIETELGDHFWTIFALYWNLYTGSHAENNLGGYEATPMTVSRAQ